MPVSNQIGSYRDCYGILDRAIEAERGTRIRCALQADATKLRARLNQARILHRKMNTGIYSDPSHPMHGRSEYDELQLVVSDNVVEVRKYEAMHYDEEDL